MTTYRNTGSAPLELPSLALGRDVAAAGDDERPGEDEFESDVDVVHPNVERQNGSSWEPTVVELPPDEPKKVNGPRKRATRGGAK